MILGIDIGGSSVKYGVFSPALNLITKNMLPSLANENNEQSRQILQQLVYDLSRKYDLEAIGIGVPGVVHNDIITSAPNFSHWENLSLKDITSKCNKKIPVYIENDANAAALAELYCGNGVNLLNFIYITLGTGVGASIIINRQLFKGTMSAAGELGHTIIDKEDTEPSSPLLRQGILERYVGSQSIVYQYYLKTNQHHSVKEIFTLASEGDVIANEILTQTSKILGIAIASTANLLAITDFIIGGGLSNSQKMLELIEDTARSRCIPALSPHVNICQAKFISDTGIYGAAILTKQNK